MAVSITKAVINTSKITTSKIKNRTNETEMMLKKQNIRHKAIDLIHKCSNENINTLECKVFWKHLDMFETDLNKFDSLMMVFLYKDMLENDCSEYCEILENKDDEFCQIILDDDIYDSLG
jgi:hypothetical protein